MNRSLGREATDGVDMGVLGPHASKAFSVRRFQNARVLWLNERWFLDRRVDIFESHIRDRIASHLVRTFGVSVPGNSDSPAAFVGVPQTLRADRYGGSSGGRHGGSGRTGFSGKFNAKGIGRTPLAADNVDWTHSHGCLWMHEAILEAINGEVVDAELPYGAVPVIAIIDTGATYVCSEAGVHERRAIVVRPNFVRPAHFERSIYFGTSGFVGSDQQVDALRTRDAVLAVSNQEDGRRWIPFAGLEGMLRRFATQLGYARALRLWQGQLLTSNLSIDGAWVDFGAFRSVQSWQRAVGQPGQEFGVDNVALHTMVGSLVFYFGKHAGSAAPNCDALYTELLRVIGEAFANACRLGLGVDDAAGAPASEIPSLMLEYFRHQQKSSFQLGRHARSVWRRPWLFDALAPPKRGSNSVSGYDLEVGRALLKALGEVYGSSEPELRAAVRVALRWLQPRPLLYYEIARPRSESMTRRLKGEAGDASAVTRYISHVLSRSRRVWPQAPRYLTILGQVVQSGSSALYCVDERIGTPCMLMEGHVIEDVAIFFGQRVPRRLIGDASSSVGNRIWIQAPVEMAGLSCGARLHFGPTTVAVPPPAFNFVD